MPTGRLIRRFLRQRRGATAIEFGLVSLPFLALLGAIIETSLAFWCGQIIDTALNDAARQLYTGQFQQAMAGQNSTSFLLSALRTRVCRVNGDPNGAVRTTIFSCDASDGVKLDVQVYTSFGTSTIPAPVTAGDWTPGFGTRYTSAQPNDIVVVQAAVKFPVFFKLLNPNQGAFSDGSRLLQSTVAFRTEPYQ